MIRFRVSGQARAKGSMRAFVPKGWTRPVVTSTNTSVKDWEHAIRTAAQEFSDAYSTGPVRVRLRFVLSRPKSLSRRASRAHTKRPDVDKLCRAALDAMTGVLWRDDSQVYALSALKEYAKQDEAPHLIITVSHHGETAHGSD